MNVRARGYSAKEGIWSGLDTVCTLGSTAAGTAASPNENAAVRAAREGGATIAPGAKTIYSNREAI